MTTPITINTSLTSLLLRLWLRLGRRRRYQFMLLVMLMLICALAEVVSLGAVLPFLAILIAPEHILHYSLVKAIASQLGIQSPAQLILPLSVLFATMALLSGLIRLLLLWLSTRVALATGSDISIEIYRRTLYQPYAVHVSRNSSEVVSGIISKVHYVVFGVLLPFLTLISSVVLLTAITLTLVAINPVVAGAATAGFGACYGVIAWVSRKKLMRNSQQIAYQQTRSIKALQEGLGGIRDVLLDGLQPVYCEIYRQADIPLRRAEAEVAFIGQSPRYVMESFGLVLIAVLAYSLSQHSGGVAFALPVLGTFAFGAQRLLPVLQQGYSSWASIAGSRASLVDTIELLEQSFAEQQSQIAPLVFKNTIKIKSLKFRYAQDRDWVLDDINLEIKKGTRVGFVGTTGSGKSTLQDIVMGLLLPNEGEIEVDGIPIVGEQLKAWQKLVAHVPQSIFLADTTLAENIAFGVAADEIDRNRLHNAARQAQIADFIESTREKYEAKVGERGVRLSGGQCQRIGIARALYKQASVLIFDEATSALDNTTEQALMDAIVNLDQEITILFVAHRLSTVRNCDLLVELEGGKIKATGNYEQLLNHSASFRKMVEIGHD